MVSETIELRGHIIDSLILPKVLDQILIANSYEQLRQRRSLGSGGSAYGFMQW